jgi:protein-S-isoprenylcysteine O-methyltransferase Ste14
MIRYRFVFGQVTNSSVLLMIPLFNQTMKLVLYSQLLFCSFVKAFTVSTSIRKPANVVLQSSSFWWSDAASESGTVIIDDSTWNMVPSGALLQGLQGFAAFVFGLTLFMITLTIFVNTMIIPKAAEELEKQTRAEFPDLWQEYQARLDMGQNLAMRPDLMQELGNRLLEKRAQKAMGQDSSASTSGESNQDE